METTTMYRNRKWFLCFKMENLKVFKAAGEYLLVGNLPNEYPIHWAVKRLEANADCLAEKIKTANVTVVREYSSVKVIAYDHPQFLRVEPYNWCEKARGDMFITFSIGKKAPRRITLCLEEHKIVSYGGIQPWMMTQETLANLLKYQLPLKKIRKALIASRTRTGLSVANINTIVANIRNFFA